ncbi:MAG TPA: biopolymer transporter ExbD, partial [Aquabacterium sp.]|nr:biopolymer transporter ExbD [Aquabacterium sp.]
VALGADGQLYAADQPTTLDALRQQAANQARRKPDTEVQLRADQGVPYGRVAELIGVLQTAGLNRVAFVTEAPAAASMPAR